jgi:hypothetical protein
MIEIWLFSDDALTAWAKRCSFAKPPYGKDPYEDGVEELGELYSATR